MRRSLFILPAALLLALTLLLAWPALPGLPGSVARADTPGSSCPISTVNDASAACYVVTTPLRAAAITMDGQNTGGEWAGAPSKTLTGDFSGTIQFMRQGDDVYLFLQATDSDDNGDADHFIITFDPRHNLAAVEDDRGFRINRNNANHEQITFPGGVETNNPWVPGAGQLAIFNTPASWSAEVRIGAAELGAPDLPALMGFAVRAVDNGAETYWPPAANYFEPAEWPLLKTRFPLEYMLVLDHSGSMLSNDRWTNATKATNILVNTMSILRDVAVDGGAQYFLDQAGVITFGWPCGSPASISALVKPAATVGSFPVGDYLGAPPPVGVPQGSTCTPIGDGLNLAFTTLDAGNPNRPTKRVALLMSDGMHNIPAGQVPLQPSHLGYSPCAAMGWPCPPGTVSNVRVDTVALGNDNVVDTALLQNIAIRYGGADNQYQLADTPDELTNVFINSIDDLYQMNIAAYTGAGNDLLGAGAAIGTGNRKAVFIAFWNTPAQAEAVTVQLANGTNVPCSDSAADTTVGFAMCMIDNPAGDTYRMRAAGGGAFANLPNGAWAIVDLDQRARFAIDQPVPGTGEPMLLTADLNDRGIPMSAANGYDVQVTARREKPDEGLGTFLATTLEGCERVETPPFKGIPDDLLKFLLGQKRPLQGGVINVAAFGQGPSITSSSVNRDPLAPAYLLAQQLFRQCEIDGLKRSDQDLVLVDDGTSGDLVADDGVYSLQVVPDVEGSETYIFQVEAKTPDGDLVHRTRRLSKYVRAEVDLDASTTDIIDVTNLGANQVTLYTVTPRDPFGGYLGPGRGGEILFTTSAGDWYSPIIDFNNGIYGRLLIWDREKHDPVIDLVVQDETTNPDIKDPDTPDPRPTPCPVVTPEPTVTPTPEPGHPPVNCFGLLFGALLVSLVLGARSIALGRLV